jgi:hypothetical protein
MRFLTSGFFHETVSPKVFQKIAKIFAAQSAPPVSTTPVASGQNLQAEKFSLFCLDSFG